MKKPARVFLGDPFPGDSLLQVTHPRVTCLWPSILLEPHPHLHPVPTCVNSNLRHKKKCPFIETSLPLYDFQSQTPTQKRLRNILIWKLARLFALVLSVSPNLSCAFFLPHEWDMQIQFRFTSSGCFLWTSTDTKFETIWSERTLWLDKQHGMLF